MTSDLTRALESGVCAYRCGPDVSSWTAPRFALFRNAKDYVYCGVAGNLRNKIGPAPRVGPATDLYTRAERRDALRFS